MRSMKSCPNWRKVQSRRTGGRDQERTGKAEEIPFPYRRIFLRRKQRETAAADHAGAAKAAETVETASEDAADENASWSAGREQMEQENMQPAAEQYSSGTAAAEKDDFEPVISHDDAEEDREVGEVNPYTGKEYQSNQCEDAPDEDRICSGI